MQFSRYLLLAVGCLACAGAILAEVPPALAAPPPAPPGRADPETPAFPAPPKTAETYAPAGAATDADGVSPLPADVIARATGHLKDLIARQNTLLDELGRSDADQDNVKRELQTLMFDYDDFLRTFPTFAPGFVAYGTLLGRVGMRRESATILLKANQLDPNLPVVKNQLGNYVAEEGEPVEAASYFISATRLAPDEPLYHYQLGRLIATARDDFAKSGQWTPKQLDDTMLAAFKRAAELAPDNMLYAYGYGESFYELADPRWDEALKVWGALEDRVSPGLEKETVRLQAANVLIKKKQFDHARLLLNTVTSISLLKQKQKLLDELGPDTVK